MTVVELHDGEPRYTPVVESRRPGPANVIELADDYWQLASRIAGTEFVPKGLRSRPEAVLAALLSGAERGLGPMESLRSVNVIEGRPALSAEAMRALVLAAGHDITILETNSQIARVVGRRRGSTNTSPEFVWTLDRARRARIAGKDNWQKYPEAMLLARATADLCRAVFPDVVAGLAVVEEVVDDEPDAEASTTTKSPPTRRQPTRRRASSPSTPARRSLPAATTPSDTPGSSRSGDIDLGGIPGADAPSWAPGAAEVTDAERKKAAAAFVRRLNAELGKAFPDADRATKDRYRHALVAASTQGRDEGPITSSTELTEAEQMYVSRSMQNIVGGIAWITDEPDGVVQLRGSRTAFRVTLEPLSVTEVTLDDDAVIDTTADDGLPAQPEFDIDPDNQEDPEP